MLRHVSGNQGSHLDSGSSGRRVDCDHEGPSDRKVAPLAAPSLMLTVRGSSLSHHARRCARGITSSSSHPCGERSKTSCRFRVLGCTGHTQQVVPMRRSRALWGTPVRYYPLSWRRRTSTECARSWRLTHRVPTRSGCWTPAAALLAQHAAVAAVLEQLGPTFHKTRAALNELPRIVRES